MKCRVDLSYVSLKYYQRNMRSREIYIVNHQRNEIEAHLIIRVEWGVSGHWFGPDSRVFSVFLGNVLESNSK